MKKVCFFHLPRFDDFFGYAIDSLDPGPYFSPGSSALSADTFRHLSTAASIDRMYRERDPAYMRFLDDFIAKFEDADLLILSTYNPVHPEVVHRHFKKAVKVLGFVDDPISTYVRGIPYLWAFDAAFYISPGYNERLLFQEALQLWGCRHSRWLPLVTPRSVAAGPGGHWPMAALREEAAHRGDAFFRGRDIDLVYIGSYQGPKVDRLIKFKKRYGSRLRIYGRWPLAGYGGYARWLKGRSPFWSHVSPLPEEEKAALYYRTRIGLNLHLSTSPMETGNMRMYEVPAHGAMLLCDKGGRDAHAQIFEPGKEAVFYDSVDDAIDKIDHYLEHEEERERIARGGFARVHRDYDGATVLKAFLDWAAGLAETSRRK